MHRLPFKAIGRASLRALSMVGLCIALFSVLFAANSAVAQSPNLVISQVYSGGGAGSAPVTFTNDYVELFNRGTVAASLSGMSIQYGSATGQFASSSSNIFALPNTTLLPGQYYLIQTGTAGAAGDALPITPDSTTTNLSMGAANGKVALASIAIPLGCGATATPCGPGHADIVDRVSWGTANDAEGTAVAALSTTTAAFRNSTGCTDTDNNGADFTVAAPAPRNSATTLAPCGPVVNTPPTVSSTTPVTGAIEIAIDFNLAVNFSEPVDLDDDWFSLDCTTSGVRGPADATVSAGPQNYTIDLASNFSDGEQCTLTIVADQVVDQDATAPAQMEEDYEVSFTAGYANACTAPHTTIGAIQGEGAVAAMNGQLIVTMGVVTADYQGAAPTLRGYFLQSQDGQGDNNPLTSDGIFVFTANDNTVNQGDLVRVVGRVSENFDQTQLSNSTATICGTGYTVANTSLTLPVSAPSGGVDFLERYEGMMVSIPQSLTVTELYFYGRFHQIMLSANGRLIQPTHLHPASDPASATLQAENDLRKIMLDDPLNGQNLMPLTFGRGGNPFTISPFNILRAGDTVSNVTGVLNYTFGGVASSSPNAWRVRPTTTVMPDFQAVNERPAPIARTAPLRVGSLNLLNFFNSFGETGCRGGLLGAVMECRGALSETDYLTRQVPKTIAALTKLDADIIAINEIENDGYGSDSAIQDLVDFMNDVDGAGTWAFINPDAALAETDTLGTDAIKVGLIYKPASVTPLGTAVLNTPEFVYTYDVAPRNRPALAQSFVDAYGAEVMVVVNHLKSKGSACVDDGPVAGVQGNCNGVRTFAANELMSWVAGLPTGTSSGAILLVGDFNSYAKEDPILAITVPYQYTDLSAHFGGPNEYSYVFGGQWGYLDYAIASEQLLDRVVYAAPWHINADEAVVLDHTTEFKVPTGQHLLWEPNEFRTSDHDPLVVDIVPPSYPLTVTVVADNGSIGSVTSIPAGISCGITCTAEFWQNSVVTLTASADVSSHLVGWSEVGCGAALTCAVPMTTTAKNVSALFDINVYTLTVATGGAGTGTVSPSGLVTATHGTTVTITASPGLTSTVAGWSEAVCGTSSTCDVLMTSDKSVTVTFGIATYPVTVEAPVNGTVTIDPGAIVCDATGATCSTIAEHDSIVTLTATPGTGYHFSSWTGACASETGTICALQITTDTTAGAIFTLNTYTLTTATSGAGSGTVIGGATDVPHGTVVNLTAEPAANSVLTSWSEAACGTALTCPVTMLANTTVTATFDLKTYTVTTPIVGPGTGTVTGGGSGILHGTVITLTAVPAENSQFQEWSDAGCGVSPTCTLTVTSNMTVSAYFDLKDVEFILNIEGDGSATPPSGTYKSGTPIILTAIPSEGWTFEAWSGACEGIELTCTFTITADSAVTATFMEIPVAPTEYTLGVVKTGNGTVTSDPAGIDCGEDCTEVLGAGTLITLTATAGADSDFTGWSGTSCTNAEATCVITMDGNRAVTATFALKSHEVIVIDPAMGGNIEVEVVDSVVAAGAGTTYPHGTVLRLTAIAEDGYNFSGWTGDAAPLGTQNPIQITVTGPLSIGAGFVSAEPARSFIFLPTVAGADE